jgi:mono/diheme cytochrome c family protein
MRADLRIGAVIVGICASGVALGLPWDVDMANSQAVKAYSQPMRPLPEGVVSQENPLSPVHFSANYLRGSPEGEALVNPLAESAEVLAGGAKMFGIYCSPCHGDGQNLGPVGAPGRFPGVAVLSGETGRVHQRSDGWIYLTVRNGGGIMPPYGWAMNDTEIWSIVHYLRTMPNSRYTPPAPAVPAEAP